MKTFEFPYKESIQQPYNFKQANKPPVDVVDGWEAGCVGLAKLPKASVGADAKPKPPVDAACVVAWPAGFVRLKPVAAGCDVGWTPTGLVCRLNPVAWPVIPAAAKKI